MIDFPIKIRNEIDPYIELSLKEIPEIVNNTVNSWKQELGIINVRDFVIGMVFSNCYRDIANVVSKFHTKNKQESIKASRQLFNERKDEIITEIDKALHPLF